MGAWTADLRYAVTDKPPYFGPYLINCPYHDDSVSSGAVYADGFYCYACGESRSAMQFLAYAHRLSLPDDYAAVKALADALPPATEVQRKHKQPDPAQLEDRVRGWAANLCTNENVPRRQYMADRGIKLAEQFRARLGWTGRAYSIPLYDRDGKLFSIKYRRADDLEPDAPKYWTQAGFGQTAIYYPPLIDWQKHTGPVVVCEGELDALRLAQEGVPAVSVTNGVRAIPNATELFPSDRLLLCLDQDEPGRDGAAKAKAALLEAGNAVSVAAWPLERGKDVTEVFQNGHGSGLLNYLRKQYRGLYEGLPSRPLRTPAGTMRGRG